MDTTYWLKQGSEPLFSELEWNKPQRRDQAGRLLIVGGSTHALSAPAKAYEYAKKQGIGAAKIVLPNKTKRLVGATLPDAVFLPSTPHGELSQEGLHDLLGYLQWADTLLIAGDVGRNSQTAILLEELVCQSNVPLIVAKDAIELLSNRPSLLLERENTTLVVSFSQLQRLLKNSGETEPIQFSMGLVQLVEYLHVLTQKYPIAIATVFEAHIITATKGEVGTTKQQNDELDPEPWRLQYASLAACYQTWYPGAIFKALTHTAHQVSKIE